ncbi:uncharacterized protein LOC131651119 [Vicia villosa]|uniref:uncharacterized protein LOC131651119 n=1 Tax=Vicia villosa TaxID=3911 RepID=UPI00273B60C3|nr:uncharacterized protein LOC131651119 [Vicia villosa]
MLTISHDRVEGLKEVKDGVKSHFENFFKEDGGFRPTLESLEFDSFSDSNRHMLEEPFSKKEIKKMVWRMILSNLLALRLRKVVGRLVSTNQYAFISRRSVMDGVLMVNKVLDMANRDRRSFLAVKVYYENAYDIVNWNYIGFILKRMRFRVKWNQWMEACIFNCTMQVIVNGSVTRDYKVEKGLRQGVLYPFFVCLGYGGPS